MDLFPTIVDLANLPAVPLCEKNTSQMIELCTEGTTLVPLLNENSDPFWNKSAVFHQYARGNKMGLSIRNQEYRYTAWLKCNPRTKAWDWSNRVFGYELYDLRTDTFENVNLATDSRINVIQRQLDTELVAGWRMYVCGNYYIVVIKKS